MIAIALAERPDQLILDRLRERAVRHLLALREAKDCSSDSGLPHSAHVMAGMASVLDAVAFGTLIDDRVHGRPDALAAVVHQIGRIRSRRAA